MLSAVKNGTDEVAKQTQHSMNCWAAAKSICVVHSAFLVYFSIANSSWPKTTGDNQKLRCVCSRTFTVMRSLQMKSGIDCQTMRSSRKNSFAKDQRQWIEAQVVHMLDRPSILIWLKPQIMRNSPTEKPNLRSSLIIYWFTPRPLTFSGETLNDNFNADSVQIFISTFSIVHRLHT
jgi:hypothetical protein